MNTFLNQMKRDSNIGYTENGALTHRTTNSKVLDKFALGGAYRTRSDADVILLFKNAFEENADLAMKCLFYLRDVRGGQGERRFFRVAYRWLCNTHPETAKKNLVNVSEFGRWDDLIYVAEGTRCQTAAFKVIKHQLALDIQCKTPSLLAKWMPSQNASNADTKRLGVALANFLNMTSREYRKTLSVLRERINVLERLMSAGRWDEIEFDKIPSKAGLVYRNAFARRDILAKNPRPARSLSVVVFTSEESSRFSLATIGSKAATGNLTTMDTLRFKDKNGVIPNQIDCAKLILEKI